MSRASYGRGWPNGRRRCRRSTAGGRSPSGRRVGAQEPTARSSRARSSRWPVKVAKVTPMTAIRASVARTRIRTIPRRRADAGAKVFESISSVLPDSSMCCRSSRGRACRGPSRAARGSAQLGAVGVVRVVGQAEEAADDVEQGIGTGGVFGGRGRAEGTPRVVEELVAEPRHGSRDRRPVRVAQVGAGGEEAVELATQLRPRCGRRAGGSRRRRGGGAAGMPSGRPRRLRRSSGTRGRLSVGRGLVLTWATKARPPAWRRTVIDGRDDQSHAQRASIACGS